MQKQQLASRDQLGSLSAPRYRMLRLKVWHAEHKDHVWCVEFPHDRDARGQPLKCLRVVNEFTRECLALEVERSITASGVVEALTELFMIRSVHTHIRK